MAQTNPVRVTINGYGVTMQCAHMGGNRAIVIPETIDAVRAVTSLDVDDNDSISRTNLSLGIRGTFR